MTNNLGHGNVFMYNLLLQHSSELHQWYLCSQKYLDWSSKEWFGIAWLCLQILNYRRPPRRTT